MSWCSRRKEGRTNPRDNLGRERLVFTRRRAPTKGECSSFFIFFFFFFFDDRKHRDCIHFNINLV